MCLKDKYLPKPCFVYSIFININLRCKTSGLPPEDRAQSEGPIWNPPHAPNLGGANKEGLTHEILSDIPALHLRGFSILHSKSRIHEETTTLGEFSLFSLLCSYNPRSFEEIPQLVHGKNSKSAVESAVQL